MPTRFDNKVVTGIGLTTTPILTASTSERITLVGFNITNSSNNDCTFDVSLTDANQNTGYYLMSMQLPSQATFKVVTNGERLVLAPTSSISLRSNQPNSLEVVMSYVAIT
jgi:hypothetical protein